MTEPWIRRAKVVISSSNRGVSVSGAKMVMVSGEVGVGVMSIFMVVAELSRRVGCMMQNLLLS